MALNHLDRDGRAPGSAKRLQSGQQGRPAGRGEEPSRPIGANIPAKRAKVIEHALRILPGELQALSIHDRVGKACLDQGITQVMQIG